MRRFTRAISAGRNRRNRKRMARRRYRRINRVPAIHRFDEWVQLPDINVPVASSAPGVGGVLSFKLSDLTNGPSMTALFDLYKITGVQLKIVPTWNMSAINTGVINTGNSDFTNQATLPMFYIAPNHDGAVPPPNSIADILNDDYCKVLRPTSPFKMYIKNPKAQLGVVDKDNNLLPLWLQFNSGSKALQPWLTTGGNFQKEDQSSYPHFGFRYWTEAAGLAPTKYHVFAKYYVSFKEQD